MTRHPFRWENLIFGVVFLAIVANWAVWKQDLLTPRELSITASAALIVLGVVGIAATLWRARPASVPPTTDTTTDTTDEGAPREEADPQS
ncbi:MAG: hypothetical protein JWR55_1910 [Aeromicrobium sp.]|jgi:hypothetical protein|nr:hypothetical protein [Aeromicrobium sp.]